MEGKWRKHNVPMVLLLVVAGVVLVFGAALVGHAVVGGMLLGVGVIAVAAICWRMGQRGVYAELEFQMPAPHPFNCRCQECLPPRHPERCQCQECLPVEYPPAQAGDNLGVDHPRTRDGDVVAVNGNGRS